MTVENVAEGFYRLVTECGTGTALAVTANTPFLVVPGKAVQGFQWLCIYAFVRL